MPLTMRFRIIGLGPRILPDRADLRVWVDNVDETYNEADVLKKTIDWLTLQGLKSVRYHVPNSTGETPYNFTLLYLKDVIPEPVSHDCYVCQCEWALITSSPLTTVNAAGESKKVSEKPNDEPYGPEFTIDTTGGTIHITQSVYTRSSHKVGTPATPGPNLKRAIGLQPDGSVKGCDIATGDVKWSVTVKGLNVTNEYVSKLAELSGKINRFEWFGRQREELQFLGAQIRIKAGDGATGTFNFHEKKTQTNVELLPGTIIPEIRGHDYVWCSYIRDTVGGRTVTVPEFVFVEQVIETKDFDWLGI